MHLKYARIDHVNKHAVDSGAFLPINGPTKRTKALEIQKMSWTESAIVDRWQPSCPTEIFTAFKVFIHFEFKVEELHYVFRPKVEGVASFRYVYHFSSIDTMTTATHTRRGQTTSNRHCCYLGIQFNQQAQKFQISEKQNNSKTDHWEDDMTMHGSLHTRKQHHLHLPKSFEQVLRAGRDLVCAMHKCRVL